MNVSRTYLTCAFGLLLPAFSTQVRASEAIGISAFEASSEELREVQDLSSEEFLQSLHIVNQAEIKMGALIIQRAGGDAQLRSYGERMVRDHKIADELVVSVAKEAKISLDAPAFVGSVSILQQNLDADFAMLESTPANLFRATLAPMAVEAHQSSLDLILRGQKEVSDLRVRAVAYLKEPIIREHLRQAQKL